MEVVSTLNLVSSEIEKARTACNFQTMLIISFVMSYDLDLMRGETGKLWIYANIKLFVVL